MKLAKTKGSNHASEAGFCCLCRRPDETRQDQRQQSRLGSRILLPPPKTLRNSPGPKAAITPQKQDFAASARGPLKPTRREGSNHASEAGFCCLRQRSLETHQAQRQQPRLKKKDFAASAKDPMKRVRIKGSNRASEVGFCCLRRRP